jgi:serine/threonine protein phosphatase PrpC
MILITLSDHFISDACLEDPSKGIFGVLDGHGGSEVSRYCSKAIPEVTMNNFTKHSIDIRENLLGL